ncbi:MAG: class I SAM-dependent methyltransferase [Lachnospiraceae bacterium]|nr:class I SAM-dependent methyltransferase [Lachnospiraceae bacterium]
MEAYTGFAQVYDTFMDETPYEEWCDYLVKLLEKYNGRVYPSDSEAGADGARYSVVTADERQFSDGKNIENDMRVINENLRQERNAILDLGCGTGTLTELLARRGYDMIGIDSAQEMLQIAMDKRAESGLDILYLLQDMRAFELYGTVGAVISVCDSVNYLLEEEDIIQTFRLVNNYLYPGGIFVFDFNTVYKYKEVIGDATIAENRKECSFIWENYYHEAEEINEYDLTIFVQEREEADTYRRFQETHYQRGYCLKQMKNYLSRAGLIFVEAIDADTHGEVTDISERIYVVAREHGK